jgi:hypothetical protein
MSNLGNAVEGTTRTDIHLVLLTANLCWMQGGMGKKAPLPTERHRQPGVDLSVLSPDGGICCISSISKFVWLCSSMRRSGDPWPLLASAPLEPDNRLSGRKGRLYVRSDLICR